MRVSVVTHPNAKNPRIEKDLFGALHVYVSAPPLEGKANTAVVESLASFFHTKKSKVLLIKGERSKQKVFEVG